MGYCGELRANTAVDVLIGPFVDSTDGYTAETGLTIDVEVSKLGQALVNKSDATVPVHDANGDIDGYYNCELDTTDTNTEGTLTLVCFAAGSLPIRHDFMVLSEAAWDSKYVAKDDGFMDVNIKTVGRADTQETEATNLEAACAAYSVTRGLSGTALPAVAADGVGGLPISDTGGLDLDAIKVMTDKIGTVVNTGGAATIGAILGDFANSALVTRLNTIDDYVDAEIGTLTTELAKVPKSDGAVIWNATALASINGEVVDALGTDTIAEMAQGIPPSAPTMKQALMYLYMALRDETNTTATLMTIKNDAGVVICKATLSDNGVTFVKGEMVSGP